MDIDIPQTVGPAGTQPEGSRENLSNWQFYSLLVAAVLGVAYLLLLQGLEVFGFVTARLPLLLPLAVTVMSIVVRAPDIKTYEGVLKTSPDIAMAVKAARF